MSLFRRMLGLETRATIISNDAGIASSDPRIREIFGFLGGTSAAGIQVNVDNALGVPAVWSAVNFLSKTLAGLPLHLYRRRGEARDRISSPLSRILHDAVNDEMSSFMWRKTMFEQVFTLGRGFTYIERSPTGVVLNLWHMDPHKMSVRRDDRLRTTYEYKFDTGRTVTYPAADVIDLPFMTASDALTTRSPIMSNRDAIGLAIAVTNYGSRFFENGGVPPFAITGPFLSADALGRAAQDLEAAVKKAASEGRQALTLPAGLEINTIGSDPEKSQFIELQRFIIEQVARIYSIPPVMLQDLTHGTFSNTEQQDLSFVKHTIKGWVEQFEAELNLKLFGRSGTRFVELSLDGLLRGDYMTRMDGNARAIQTGQLTPNEARRMENRPELDGGDDLFMQGATVPIGETNAPEQ